MELEIMAATATGGPPANFNTVQVGKKIQCLDFPLIKHKLYFN